MHLLENFRKLLAEAQLDGYFSSSVSNITYLTGFTGDSSRLLVSGERAVLITDGRYTEQAQKECYPGVEVYSWIENKRYASPTYHYLISELKIQNLGIEGNSITFAEYEVLSGTNTCKISAISGLTEQLRRRKSPEEIEYLKTACQISDQALAKTLPDIKEGITELELVAKLEYHLKMCGAEDSSFSSMVLSGNRTSLLHGKPGTRKIRNGDFILFDFGAKYKGYHADVSRTFILGNASNQQTELYHIIQRAQEAAVSALKAGVTSKELDSIVRGHIPQKYLEYYYPGLGHGVGLEIHESPFVGRDYEVILEEDMVITIEPGIYIPDWGGLRIEDTVWVNRNGSESLSEFTRDLMIL
jgi:Xaa-Pro aminopeptidase